MNKMRMKNVVIAAMVGISAMCWRMASADTWTDENGNEWSYTTNANAITITGCSFVTNTVSIPSTIDEMEVTAVGAQAFKGNAVIKELTIPDSVTSIGQGVFSGCTALETITLGNGIVTLTGVDYGNNIWGLYRDHTGDTALEGNYANALFYNCTSLKTVNWGAGVKTIGNIAFLNCSALESITIPDTVTNLGHHVFVGCRNLRSVKVGNGIPEIGLMAFRALPSLTHVDLGTNVVTINNQAFQDCTSLKSITLPDSIRNINYRAFAGAGLTAIDIPTNGNGEETILGQGVFAGCTTLENVSFGDTVVTLTGVDYGNNIWGLYRDQDYNNNATSTSLEGSHANGLFYNCTALKTINWGDGVRSIGNVAFLNCTALTDVVLPTNVTSIGNHAFFGCSSLRTVTIRGDLESIGRYAFSYCGCLHYVDYQGGTITTTPGFMPFKFDKSRVTIYVDERSTGWTGVAGETGLPDGGSWCGTAIAYGPPPEIAMYKVTFDPRNGSLSDSSRIVYDDDPIGTLPVPTAPDSNWKFMGWFTDAVGGTQISASTEISSEVTIFAHWTGGGTWIDDRGIAWSYSLDDDSVSLGGGDALKDFCGELKLPSYIHGFPVSKIEEWAFEGCGFITDVTIPDTVIYIGDAAFIGCSKLEHVEFGTNVQSIGKCCFALCGSLKSVDLPDSVTDLSAWSTFGECDSLKRIKFGNGIVKMDWDASYYEYQYLVGGKWISLDNLGVIASPLWGCTGLETIEIGSNVVSVAPSMCFNSINLKRVICEGLLPGCNGGLKFQGGAEERFCYVRRDVYPDGLPAATWAGLTLRYLDDYYDPSWWNAGGTAHDVSLEVDGIVTNLVLVAGEPFGELPQPAGIRVGYTFDAWYTGENGTGVKAVPEAIVPDDNFSLYANWTANIYTVSFNANGGEGEMPDQHLTYDLVSRLSTNTYSYGDKVFCGWATNETSEVVFVDGAEVLNLSAVAGSIVDLYAVWDDTEPVTEFAASEVAVAEGESIVIAIRGGNEDAASSVDVYLTYNTAVAADVDLKTAAVDSSTGGSPVQDGGANAQAARSTNLKFPIALNWAAGEVGEKVITIPVKTDKAVEDDEFFTLQLADAQGMELGEDRVCTVTIHDPGYDALAAKIADGSASKAEKSAWEKLQKAKAPYIRGLADPANAGKVTGSGLCAAGKKVTLKASANKGFVFVGWMRDGDSGTGGYSSTGGSPVQEGDSSTGGSPVQEGDSSTGGSPVQGDDENAQAARSTIATTPSLVIDRSAKPGKSTATSTTITDVDEDTTFYACFITSNEDKASIVASVDGLALAPWVSKTETHAFATNIWAGVYLEWPVAASALSEAKVKVSGLPAGLKFAAKPVTSKVGSGKNAITVTNVPANTIYGAPTAASKAAARRAGDSASQEYVPSQVKVTVTTAGKSSQTYQIDTTVMPLPAWAVGTFAGEVFSGTDGGDSSTGGSPVQEGDSSTGGSPVQGGDANAQAARSTRGTVSLTIDAKGKISGKALADELTYTLAAPYYSGFAVLDDGEGISSNFFADVTASWSYKEGSKTVKTNEVVRMTVQDNGVGGVATGGAAAWGHAALPDDGGFVETALPEWVAWQYNWTVEPWKTLGMKFDKNVLVYAIRADGSFIDGDEAEAVALDANVTGRVTLKFSAKGTASVSGEFVTGYNGKKYTTAKATASVTLVPVDEEHGTVFIYLMPKGGTPHARCVDVPWPLE